MIIDTTIGERGLTEHYPELGTGPVSTEPYYSEAHYELEKQRLFKRTWLSIGRVEQVAEPGDYFVTDLAVADTSILVVRGEDNQIRGFHNMCSHRGNKLVWEEKGSSSVRYAYRAELRCNWKVSLDAFCEGYHVMFLHKKWGRETFTTSDNP